MKPLLAAALCALLLAAAPLRALNPALKPRQYKTDSWNADSGLPQNAVYTMLQTGDGYLWLGVEEGLIRFDGVGFTAFDNNNTPAFRSNFIYSLAPGANGRLWIGTRGGGVICYENHRFQRLSHPALNDCSAMDLLEDKDGGLWIAAQHGLLHKHGNQVRLYTRKDGLAGDWARHIRRDDGGRLWISTRSGVSIMENGRFHNLQVQPGAGDVPRNRVRMTFQDSRGTVWAATYDGLWKLEGERFVPAQFRGGLPDPRILCIAEDRDHNMWIGSPSGLTRVSGGVAATLSRKDGLPDDYILSLLEDREGNLWTGSAYGGLIRLRDPKFITVSARDGLPDDVVFAIVRDQRGSLWFGTNGGVGRLRGDQLAVIAAQQGLCDNAVNTLCAAPDGTVWAGTEKGLNRLRDNHPAPQVIESHKGMYVVALHADRSGTLWIGSDSGLWRKKNGDPPAEVPQFKNSHVNVIFETRDGAMWIATYPNGAVRIKNGRSTLYSEKNGLAGDSVNCMYEDASGAVWVGANKGLSRVANGKIVNFTKKNGLHDNNIYKILEDNRGCLWMSCNKGVFRVRRDALEKIAASGDPGATVSCDVFGREDGMLSRECNGGFQTAGCAAADGTLWFPTMKGAAGVQPDAIPINAVIPPVIVESADIDGQRTPFPSHFSIRPGAKRVEFAFAALSLQAPSAVRFRCRLQGFADEWVNLGTHRNVSFTNLDPGDYIFSVTACNNDNLWNPSGASVSFTVIAPLWRKTGFQALALLFFALCSYFLIHFIRKMFHIAAFWRRSHIVGHYRILEKLGAGGMGAVYKARDVLGGRDPVALKVLREELFADEGHRKRFKQEAAIVDQLDHPNIVRVFERGQSRDAMYIAMELLEGKTLADKIRLEARIAPREALHIMIQAADALARVHSKNIIHRDLKPDNIMLVRRGDDPLSVKLLDFGLARMESQSRLTQTGMVIGTLNYMAPEQISGSAYSPATDVYSLGVIFYEMLTGMKPFTGESTLGVMRRIMNDIPIDPADARNDLPAGLNELVMSMIEKEGEQRPGIEEILRMLKHIRERSFH